MPGTLFALDSRFPDLEGYATTEQKLDEGKGYIIKVQGTNGSVLVLCGSPSYDTTGFNLIAKGKDFAYYVSDNVTVEGLTPGNDDEEEKTITVNVAMTATSNARSARNARRRPGKKPWPPCLSNFPSVKAKSPTLCTT